MPIRQLPPIVVNRIAAGEVVERPAAAVKELVENAIDAGATRIDISLREGGQALIAVADNGSGMSRDELVLAVERHCTSKLPDDDLLEITALGFRGEALPSIGAVSRLRITSRPPGAESAWEIAVEAGTKHDPVPAAHPPGTPVVPRVPVPVGNGRPVRDKLLVGAVRGAYQDVLARDRHPIVALFLDGPAGEIDVNVHPAKAEVRFRDAGLIRGLIVGALRHALEMAGQRSSTTMANATLAAFRPAGAGNGMADTMPRFAFPPSAPPPELAEAGNRFLMPRETASEMAPANPGGETAPDLPLGEAPAQ